MTWRELSCLIHSAKSKNHLGYSSVSIFSHIAIYQCVMKIIIAKYINLKGIAVNLVVPNIYKTNDYEKKNYPFYHLYFIRY